ncbi:MAG: thioredoxin-dependent thiol peroxidase [Acidobacteria bacterium]|nr:MAG: thioredoxin-dependent thiol peroxidase [Acidobacteriota bacterium]
MVMDVNQKAPNFTLPDENGEPVTLASFQGKPLVLFFYSRANTAGCTKEASGFRDQYKNFTDAGFTILGISPDASKAQKKFHESLELPYTLLADADKEVAQLFGVYKEINRCGRKGMGIERTTFLIAPDGTITHVWRKVKPEGHAEQVLAKVQSNN